MHKYGEWQTSENIHQMNVYKTLEKNLSQVEDVGRSNVRVDYIQFSVSNSTTDYRASVYQNMYLAAKAV